MVNNAINIHKTNNHLSPQIIEHTQKKRTYGMWCWIFRSRIETGTNKSGEVNIINLFRSRIETGTNKSSEVNIINLNRFTWKSIQLYTTS